MKRRQRPLRRRKPTQTQTLMLRRKIAMQKRQLKRRKAAVSSRRCVRDRQLVAAAHKLRKRTYFLALDKVGRGKDFLQIMDVHHNSSGPFDSADAAADSGDAAAPVLRVDRDWLAIVHATGPLYNGTRNETVLPSDDDMKPALEKARALVNEHISDADLVIAPPQAPNTPGTIEVLLQRLRELEGGAAPTVSAEEAKSAAQTNDEAIELDDDDDDDDDGNGDDKADAALDDGDGKQASAAAVQNEEEIELEE